METANTFIEFVAKKTQDSVFPSLPDFVPTGDFVGFLVSILFAFAFVAMLVQIFSKRANASAKVGNAIAKIDKKLLAFAIGFCPVF